MIPAWLGSGAWVSYPSSTLKHEGDEGRDQEIFTPNAASARLYSLESGGCQNAWGEFRQQARGTRAEPPRHERKRQWGARGSSRAFEGGNARVDRRASSSSPRHVWR